MAFCSNCGKEVSETSAFCPNCGKQLNRQPTVAQPAAKVRQIDTGMLVFSILTLIFLSRILGIIALVFTIMAKDAATDEEEKQKLQTAKTLNIVALSVVGGIIALVIVSYLILLLLILFIPFGFLALGALFGA